MHGDPNLSPEALERDGAAVLAWIASYFRSLESLPVRSALRPGDVRSMLPDRAPEHPEPFARCLEDMDRVVLPGLMHWQSPRFFGYFPCNTSVPSILGELLAAGLATQGMLWQTSPACTEIESHVLDWLVHLLGLPEAFLSTSTGGGVIQDSASSATLCALLAARERASGFRTRERGIDRPFVAYCSDQAHSSVEKAMAIAGIGTDHLRRIPTDAQCAMRPEPLAERMAQDRAAGMEPFFVTATIGTTAANGMDPLTAIGRICAREGAWLHVDAAMSGTAALCPEFRGMHEGIHLVDSYCFNPHKWMFTNFDCDCFWVRDRQALLGALSILPEYLRNEASESGAVIDYRDWQIPLGRRFRALKLWFVLRCYGAEGLRARIREHVADTAWLAGRIADDPRLELLMPPPLNLLCFRVLDEDDAPTRRLLADLNRVYFLTHAVIDGRFFIRVAAGGMWTERHHLASLLEAIRNGVTG